jgi:hypothetical protein
MAMQLRNHPLMSFRTSPNWPPAWSRIRGGVDRHPQGEVGILREIVWSPIQVRPLDRFFLVIEYEGTIYMGCLLFDDAAFCLAIQRLLRGHAGCTIEHIGGLDVDHTL